jgi:EpsI family protein
MRHVRFAVVALALLLPATGLARFVASRGLWSGAIHLDEIPRQIGPWSVQDEQALSPEELTMLQPDGYTARLYAAPDRPPIWLYVAFYSRRSAYGKGAHDPAICYPAQGWEVLSTRSVEVALPRGERLVGTVFRAHQGRVQQDVLYWFQPAERWPQGQAREQLARVWDAVAGRPQYAFVRLAAMSRAGEGAERDLLEFASELGWPVRRALGPEEMMEGPLARARVR